MRGVRISARTVRNRLREFGLNARRPYVGLPLTDNVAVWNSSLRTVRACFLFGSGEKCCSLTSPGFCCTVQTEESVSADVEGNVYQMLVWWNVIVLEVVG